MPQPPHQSVEFSNPAGGGCWHERFVRRNGFWNSVRGFMGDINGTVNFAVGINETIRINGGCPRPDEAMMMSEGSDPLDEQADRMGWTPQQRKAARRMAETFGHLNRMTWLRNQVNESVKTGRFPIREMSPGELRWFLREFRKAKAEAKSRNAVPARRAYIKANRHKDVETLAREMQAKGLYSKRCAKGSVEWSIAYHLSFA